MPFKSSEEKQFYEDIGTRLKIMRMANKDSQEALGEFLGVTFQQVQKYERASNRLPLYALMQISERYETHISHFLTDGSEAVLDDYIATFMSLRKSHPGLTFDERQLGYLHALINLLEKE